MAHRFWPLFDIRVRTARLELRVPTDDDFSGLLDAVASGIHDPAFMPFAIPWTDIAEPGRTRNTVQHWWRARAEWKPEQWNLPLMVTRDGQPLGFQDAMAEQFAVLRTVTTGSWLRRDAQGQGIGKEMRAAVLHVAFEGLGADVACSAALVGNDASAGVSEALGYEFDGWERKAPRGTPVDVRRYRLTRERWESRPRIDVDIEGLEPCLPMFGLG